MLTGKESCLYINRINGSEILYHSEFGFPFPFFPRIDPSACTHGRGRVLLEERVLCLEFIFSASKRGDGGGVSQTC